MKTDGTGAAHPFFRQPPHFEGPERRLRFVRVRAIGPRRFCVDGRAVPEGEIVDVPEFVSTDLVAVGKAELC
jgi:hypothetical protein